MSSLNANRLALPVLHSFSSSGSTLFTNVGLKPVRAARSAPASAPAPTATAATYGTGTGGGGVVDMAVLTKLNAQFYENNDPVLL